MYLPDLEVLNKAKAWLEAGNQVYLFTVVQTWGSAPRLPGAIMAMRDDGHLSGSVSGGCVEDDLADKARRQQLPSSACLIDYGVKRADAQRFGIPCGGTLQLLVEPLQDVAQILPAIDAIMQRQLIKRSVQLTTGLVQFSAGTLGSTTSLAADWVHSYFGPKWRMLIIGANQLGAILAQMAQTLEFEVLVCDPRKAIRDEWQLTGVTWLEGMPDDAVLAIVPDAFTAIVAVTHDPKLDDMALLEALKCDAFYVGALGSRNNQANRRARLQLFDLTEAEINRLHGPVGLTIGSRTPAEIAIAILAEIIQIRAQQRLTADTVNKVALKSLCMSG